MLSLTTRPHLPLLWPRLFIYRHATVISILTLLIMRSPLNTGTHMDMPTGIRKGRTSLWGLNLPLRVVLMDPKKRPFSLNQHPVVRPRSRGWIRRARGSRLDLRAPVYLQGGAR